MVSTTQPLGVFGTLADYDPASKVTDLRLDKGGSDYGPDTQVVITGGGGTGAKGVANIKDGVIQSIGFLQEWGGSGYTSAPTVTFMDPSGKGHGAEATAVISGGTITVNLAKPLPTGQPLSFDFKRKATDYAAKDMTNLWYSWAHYYVEQFSDFGAPETIEGSQVYGKIGEKSGLLTNAITLSSTPTKALAVGMGVTSNEKGIVPAGTTILKIVGNTVYLSQIPLASKQKAQQYTFSAPQGTSDRRDVGQVHEDVRLTFGAADAANAKLFAGSVYESMQAQSVNTPPSSYLPDTMNVVDNVIKFYANLPTHDKAWGTELVGQVRDVAKSILRGVYDYFAVPNQSLWYPNPATPTGGQTFNVYNLDPYVWFAHTEEGLSGYAFSIDDDVANPSATGPKNDDKNHAPDNLQIGFAGIKGTGDQSNAPALTNQSEWFPTTKWGTLSTTATIGIEPPDAPAYAGYSFITLTGDDPLRTLNQIITPGPGQIGAYISAPGYIVPGTTLIYFPNGVSDADAPTVILSQNAISTTDGKSIPVTISASISDAYGQKTIPTVPINNANFANPPQTSPPYYTTNPTGPNVGWTFMGTAGIAGTGSVYTKNNTPPVGEQQVAFITDQGSISQAVNLVPGEAYAVSFVVAEQALDNGTFNTQSLDVGVGSELVGTFTPGPAAGGSYVLFTSNAFTVPSAGSYNVTITGKSTAGSNNTALVGTVTVTGGLG